MTFQSDLNRDGDMTPLLPFPGRDVDRMGIRVTRSQLAVLLDVSKQTTSQWVKQGRVVLGADGRVDPRQAIAQLLRTGNPAQLRSRLLAPLVQELDAQRARIRELETKLAAEVEESDFAEDAFDGVDQILDALVTRIGEADRDGLRITGAAVAAWEHAARQLGGDAGPLADFEPAGDSREDLPPGEVDVPVPALVNSLEGAGFDDETSTTGDSDA